MPPAVKKGGGGGGSTQKTAPPKKDTPKTAPPTHYRSPSGDIKAYRDDPGYQAKFGTSRPALGEGTHKLGSGQYETGGGGGGGGGSNSTYDFISEQYGGLGSAEDQYRAEQEAYERRLAELVDPVLREQEGLLTALSGRTNLEDYYNQLREERGVPVVEALLRNLERQQLDVTGLLEKLPEDVTKRTAGTMTTEAQRRRIEASEREPLTGQLSALTSGMSRERAGYGDLLSAIQNALSLRTTQEERELEPSKLKLQFAGEKLDIGRQTAAQRLQTMLAGISEGRTTSMARIQDAIRARLDEDARKDATAKALLQNAMARQGAEEDIYLQAGLLPGTATRSPVGDYLEQQRQLQRGEELTDYEKKQAIERRYSKSGGGGGGGTSDDATSWAYLIQNGSATIANVPARLKSQVASLLAAEESSGAGAPVPTSGISPAPAAGGFSLRSLVPRFQGLRPYYGSRPGAG